MSIARIVSSSEMSSADERFIRLISFLPQAILIVDGQGSIWHANPAAEQFIGRSNATLCGTKLPFEVTPKKTQVKIPTEKGEHAAIVWAVEGEWIGQVAKYIYMEPSVLPFANLDTPATELHLLQTLIDSIPDLIFIKDLQGRYVLCNQTWRKVADSYTNGEAIGKTDYEIYPPEIAEQYRVIDLKIMESGQPMFNIEESRDYRDGHMYWDLINKIPLFDTHGNLQGLMGMGRDITERKLAEQRLDYERRLLLALIENIPDLIFIKDPQGHYLLGNTPMANMVGLPSTEYLIGKTDFDIFPHELSQRYAAHDHKLLQTHQSLINHEEPIIDSQGNVHWYWTTKVPFYHPNGEAAGLLGISRDITEHRQMELDLEKERSLLRVLIDHLPDSVYVKDMECRKILANARDLEFMGLSSEAEALGKSDFEIYPQELAAKFHQDDQSVLQTGIPVINREELFHDSKGQTHWLLTSKLPLHDATGSIIGILGIGHDITERKKAEIALKRANDELEDRVKERTSELASANDELQQLFKEIQRLAITDSLTGIHNRRHFMDRAHVEFKRAQRHGTPLSTILLDLDHFKNINDTYGHLTGDRVLQAVATACHDSVRTIDLLGRYGGEEFIILLPETSLENAQRIAERVLSAICNLEVPTTMDVNPAMVCVTVSIGVAEMDKQTLTLDELIAKADQSMYRAKDAGRNRISL